MRKTLTIFALMAAVLFLSGEGPWAQSGWVWQNPKPVGDGLGKIQFVSASEGWITTEGGQLLHTINGGANWTLVTPDSTGMSTFFAQPAQALSFISATTGWVIGTNGGFSTPDGPVLYKTTDGGATWTSQFVGAGVVGAILGVQVQFLDASSGWAAIGTGRVPDSLVGVLRRSTDGGVSWNTVHTFPTNDIPLSFTFGDALNGWAMSDSLDPAGGFLPPSRILRTTDGGANWIEQFFDGTAGIFNAMQFVDLNNGWVVGGSAKIFRTTNGGAGWTPLTNAGLDPFSLNTGLFFIDANTGWIGNYDFFSGSHQILHTTDGGANWTPQDPGLDNTIFSLHFLDATNGWAASDFGGIAHTTDGGSTWNLQSSAFTTGDLAGVATLPGDLERAWAVSQFGNIWRTTDGGTNWSFPSSPPPPDNFHGVSFVDANTGYAVADFSVAKTTDGGDNWGDVRPVGSNPLFAADFVNADLGWVVGAFGTVYRTNDGGSNWSITNPGSPDLHGVSFVDASNGWVAGNAGIIYWTVDSGNTWISQTSGTSQNLKGIYFTDLLSGTAVGDSGVILRTTDAGVNWNPQTSGTGSTLYGVDFTDANNGWVVGNGNLILNTTDGGTTWIRQFGGASFGGLKGVSFSSSNSGVAVGDNGTVLHFGQIPTDVPKEKINRPVGFELSQNYPNPFNPATSIRFSLSKRQKVTLEIFNLLGERVKLLANDEKAAGEHTVVWDGRDDKGRTLSSGVYFYRLKGEDFAETKRMIFLK